MKRIALLLFLGVAAWGQVQTPPGVVVGSPTPGGACVNGPGQLVTSTGTIYTCVSSVWTATGTASYPGVSSNGSNGLDISGTAAATAVLIGGAQAATATGNVQARPSNQQLSGRNALYGYGTSIMRGHGAASCPANTPQSTSGTCWFDQVGAALGITAPNMHNLANGGDDAADLGWVMLNQSVPSDTDSGATLIEAGTNDVSTGNVGYYETVYRNSLLANAAYQGVIQRQTGLNTTPASNWSTIAFPGVTGLISSTSGAAQVWPYVPPTVDSTPCVFYLAMDGNNATFDISDDSGFFNTVHAQAFSVGQNIKTFNNNGWALWAQCFPISGGRTAGNTYHITTTVTSATGVMGGTGYTSGSVTFGTNCTPSTGTPATAHVTVSGAAATAVLDTGGSGYANCSPAVNISGDGSGALAWASYSAGAVTALNMIPSNSVVILGVGVSPGAGVTTTRPAYLSGVYYQSCDYKGPVTSAYDQDALEIASQVYGMGFNVGWVQPRNYWTGQLSQSELGTCGDVHPNGTGHDLIAAAWAAPVGLVSKPLANPPVTGQFNSTRPTINPIFQGLQIQDNALGTLHQNFADQPYTETYRLGKTATQVFCRAFATYVGVNLMRECVDGSGNWYLLDASSNIRMWIPQAGVTAITGDGTNPLQITGSPVAVLSDLTVATNATTTVLTNGTWTTQGGCSSAGITSLSCSGGSGGTQVNIPTPGLVAGNVYSITYTLSISAGSVIAEVFGGTNQSGTVRRSSATYTDVFTAQASIASFGFFASSGFNGTLTSIAIAHYTGGTLKAGAIALNGCAAGTYALADGTGCGTPASGGTPVSTWSSTIYASLNSTGSLGQFTPNTAVKITRFEVTLASAMASCSTNPIVSIYDQTAASALTSLTLANTTLVYDSGVLSIAVTAGHVLRARITTAGVACSPANPISSVNMQYTF